jgi:hypothetical protein
MTSLTISDELAATITTKAAERMCSPEDLLLSMVSDLKSDEELAERVLTPELRSRFAHDLARVDKGEFYTEEQVNARFEKMFAGINSR